MSNYCTCHIDKENCFWCDYQNVKRSLETYKKVNRIYREALEDIRDINTGSPHKFAVKALEVSK